jgi:pimeloyl-ACP methyl ester carboxylesterase
MPGGRLSKETPGIRELAMALADRGNRVLIWDRPNCGASDVCFAGASESALHGDVLAGLLQTLDMAPAVLSGGSNGARVSLTAARSHPEVTAGVAVWWVSGGAYQEGFLANLYCAESIRAAWTGGMDAVVALPEWAEVLAANPANRQRFLDQDRGAFIATMERWMRAYFACHDGETVLGLPDADAATLDMPVLVFRGGSSDVHHPRAVSEHLAGLLPRAELVDSPWPDTEFMDRRARGEVGFPRWPMLAPQLVDWADAQLP